MRGGPGSFRRFGCWGKGVPGAGFRVPGAGFRGKVGDGFDLEVASLPRLQEEEG